MSKLKAIIKQNSLFLQIRYAAIYLYFQGLFRPSWKRVLIREYQLYQVLFKLAKLDPAPLVFDIGANEGYTVATFLKLGASRVIALEPDPQGAAILRTRFRSRKQVHILPMAVAAEAGKAYLFRHSPAGALNTLSEKWKMSLESSVSIHRQDFQEAPIEVHLTTLDQLIQQFGCPKFIKIDVEGYEQEVLTGLSQAIPLIGFECNLPQFLPESIACIQKLNRLSPSSRFFLAANLQLSSTLGMKAEDMIARIQALEESIDIYCITSA